MMFSRLHIEPAIVAGIEISRAIRISISQSAIEDCLYGVYIHDGARLIKISNGCEMNINKRHGIYIYEDVRFVKILGNDIFDNGMETANTYDGVHIADGGTGCSEIHIKDNAIRNINENCTRYAIREQDLSDYNQFFNNDVYLTLATPHISCVGANTKVKFNYGFVTENSGTATVASGATVAHGLIDTPTVITVTAAESGATDIYTSDAGADTFKINFTGEGAKTFYWTAEYKP